jgi:hypothetical protein
MDSEEEHSQIKAAYDLLKRQGYAVEELKSSWFWLKVEDYSYCVFYNEEDDASFFRIVFPISLDENQKATDPHILTALNVANKEAKLAKAFLDVHGISFAVDVLSPSPKDFAANFQRYISAIQVTLELYESKVED